MATIDDLGGAADSLGSVPLGGPNGWAAAVRDAIKDRPTTGPGVRIQHGYTASDISGVAAVTFAQAFTQTPSVILTPTDNSVTSINAQVRTANQSGFTFCVTSKEDAYIVAGVSWIAIGV